MYIEGQIMRIQAWTPTFCPEEKTPIVPVWVILPDLPWHSYKKEFVVAVLAPLSKVLYLDTASIQKTRGSVAKQKFRLTSLRKDPLMFGWAWMKRILLKEDGTLFNMKVFLTIAPIANIKVTLLIFALSREG